MKINYCAYKLMREKNAKGNKLKHVNTQKSIKEQIQNAKNIRYRTAKERKKKVKCAKKD